MSRKSMDAFHIFSNESNHKQVLKPNECKPTKFKNRSHTVEILLILQSLSKYVIRLL